MNGDTYTVELTAWEANWLLDIIRWQREAAEESSRTRSARKIGRVEETVGDALPDKGTLAEEIHE